LFTEVLQKVFIEQFRLLHHNIKLSAALTFARILLCRNVTW